MITQSKPSPHDAILMLSTHGPKEAAIRMGNWKLIALGADEKATLPKPNSKVALKYETLALFDLANDPGETKNLATQFPERTAAMRKKLAEMLKDAAPLGGGDAVDEK